MLETKVIVAPNSPRLRAKESSIPVRIPGRMSGRVTLANTHRGGAPSVAAAASSPGSTASSDWRTARTSSGRPITAQASAAPVQRKMKVMPRNSSRKAPIGPRRPSNSRRKYPTTTGGSTKGRCTTASSRLLPGKLSRERTQASATATGKLAATLQNATLRLRRRAVVSAGDRLHTDSVYGEAVLLENCARLGPEEKFQKREAPFLSGLEGRDRVDDGRMRIGGEYACDHDATLGIGVSLVNHAERRLAARHERKRSAHVLRGRDARRDLIPDAELLDRRLGVLAGRHAVRLGERDPAVSERPGDRKSGGGLELHGLLHGGDQHKAVAEEVAARARREEFFSFDVVHPVEVGRDEEVGRRTVLDLARERSARAVGNDGFSRIERNDFVQCLLETRCGEHRQRLSLCGKGPTCKHNEYAGHYEMSPSDRHPAIIQPLSGLQLARSDRVLEIVRI